MKSIEQFTADLQQFSKAIDNGVIKRLPFPSKRSQDVGSSMTLKQIKYQSSEFSKGIIGSKSSTRMCFIVCIALRGYLHAIGVECRLIDGWVKGHPHCWIKLDNGLIIDPTADQFGLKNKFVSRRPSFYTE